MKIKKVTSVLFLAMLIIAGCNQTVEQKPQVQEPIQVKKPVKEKLKTPVKEKVKAPVQQQTKAEVPKPVKIEKTEKVIAPTKENTPPVKLDKFGRSLDHPHYGHNHAVNQHAVQNTDSTQNSTEGKPDKYGRKPGHPHYGHNHK